MKILAIATNTFKETIRDKILYNLLIFALIMIGLTIFLGELTIAEQTKMTIDLGLASISIFGTLIAIFIGIGLVYKEIDRRTIYTIISKPVRRYQFLLGKFLGLLLTIAVNLGIMVIGFIGVLYFIGSRPSSAIFAAILLIYVELMVITAIAMLFSTFTTPILSAIFTLSFYVMGHLVRDMRYFAAHTRDEFAKRAFAVITRIAPDLERFNLREWAAYSEPVDPYVIWWSCILGIIYAAFFIILGAIIFQRRDFK